PLYLSKCIASATFVLPCQFTSTLSSTSNKEASVTLTPGGLPRFHIPLPSRDETCIFSLRPLSNNVGDLVKAIENEDRGIDRVAFLGKDGLRFAKANSIEMLLANDFVIEINDKRFPVSVANLGETRRLTWLGLGAMGLQFGLLARLTWWEYSWDIMEPVTYFVGYGTTMAIYAYFVVTRQDYSFPEVFDREYLKAFYKGAAAQGFDVERYNNLRNSLAQLQSDLKRLRDPLYVNLPLQQTKYLVKESVEEEGTNQ
ncbi:unnamed protein product, partial [Hymenolepis diminuta]|uniref:Calcium uniporter protein n=1 Tax=Hymenolepis diminuta TaxID=6216 RepID=A0A158QBS5_HYMDI